MTADKNPSLNEQAPWEQVAALHRKQSEEQRAKSVAPRLQLRGDQLYLRALRAAEMTAWGDTTFFPGDRQMITRHLTLGR